MTGTLIIVVQVFGHNPIFSHGLFIQDRRGSHALQAEHKDAG